MGNKQSVPVSIPTLETYISFLLPNEASFSKTLTQRKTFDIHSKSDKIVDFIGHWSPTRASRADISCEWPRELSHLCQSCYWKSYCGYHWWLQNGLWSGQYNREAHQNSSAKPSTQPHLRVFEQVDRSGNLESWFKEPQIKNNYNFHLCAVTDKRWPIKLEWT